MKITTLSYKENIQEESVLTRVTANTVEYGNHVIENRAVPDYRDGLKPVARKILWNAYIDGFKSNGPYYKSARLVGSVVGRFSPHGDQSVYQALVKMVNLPVALMAKQGNFGSVNDDTSASMRYTEVRLSKYGEKEFFNSYLDQVVPMMPNYDGREKEPLFLPALMPNLLMNGTSGIGVGVTCDIPPLHIDSLIPFIEQAFRGEELSVKALAKKLRFNWKYGSHCVSSQDEIINWLKNGSQSLWFEPDYQLDSVKRLITINEVPPGFDWDKIVGRLLGEETKGKNKGKKKYDFITAVEDECSFSKKKNKEIIAFTVKLKNTIDPDEFSELAKIVIKEFTNYTKTATNVTFRKPNEVKFVATNIPDLITRWANYRVKMEKSIISCIIAEIDKNIASKDLLLLAIDNRQHIKDAMEVSKPYDYVQEKLKITHDQSRIVLGWSVISLAKVSKSKVIEDKLELIAKKKTETKLLANPNSKILTDLSEGAKLVTK